MKINIQVEGGVTIECNIKCINPTSWRAEVGIDKNTYLSAEGNTPEKAASVLREDLGNFWGREVDGLYSILLIGGKHHNTFTKVCEEWVINEYQLQVLDEQFTPSVFTDQLPTEAYVSFTTYDVIPVMWNNKIINYYGKECSIGDSESFELYKEIKEKT